MLVAFGAKSGIDGNAVLCLTNNQRREVDKDHCLFKQMAIAMYGIR